MTIATAAAGPGIVCNSDFLERVRAAGLADFEMVMQLEGELIKCTGLRRTVMRFTAAGPPDATMHLFLKRHRSRSLLHLQPDALDEFRALCAFHLHGIPTMIPVAAGARRRAFGRESFLLTLALEGCERLDHVLSPQERMPFTQKSALIAELACLVMRMHAAGFNHRDLYLCHILRAPDGRLFVADLHRVQQRMRVPRRWLVKDLAALNYSATGKALTRTARLRFVLAYLGCRRLNSRGRRLIFSVLKKTEKMIQHNTSRNARCSC